MPMVEFVWWPGTDAFLSDLENVISATVAHISSAPGCLRIFYGLEEEDRTKFWMIVVWQSHAHHQAMMDSPDYALMVGRLRPYFGGELKMNHVEFVHGEGPAFGAPITTISFLKSTKDSGGDEVDETLKSLTKSSGAVGATWGQTQEDASLKIGIFGSEMDESHPSSSFLVDSNVETIHVRFKEVFVAE
ncbi:hypothetical protein BDN70DRAFT_681647 [Pholiota conissans]|uniref:ABM domain-containing protein n=1 Tax=Pholiota conissans TaxID=109636 RepID=A0A9P5ZBM8_9AGAR|nr:hypothetical protein BDN70DRAFT_681647 [Pholiota conissans]